MLATLNTYDTAGNNLSKGLPCVNSFNAPAYEITVFPFYTRGNVDKAIMSAPTTQSHNHQGRSDPGV